MAAEWTVDANILVYCVDRQDPVRKAVAEAVMRAAAAADIALARQVIGEFFHAASRKGKLPARDASRIAQDYASGYETFGASADAFVAALDEAASGRTQFWDAMLLAACAEKGIGTLLTEDMAPGRHRMGVEIVNPFKPDPAARKTLKKLGLAAR